MRTIIFRLAPLMVLLSLNCSGQGYQLTDLGALTGTNSYAQGINNQQQVVGYWDTTNGTHAFLYDAGAITDLGTLGGLNSYALNINSAGQIVGFSETPEGVGAFLYGSGGMTNLGTLGGLDSYGFGINDTADIVGCIETTNGFQAILLSNGEVTQLGTLGGTNSFAYSVNLTRQVAGTSLTSDNVSPNAFLWQDNLLTNLNDLLPLGSGWQLQEARAINNAGQIVGWGLLNSVKHAFLFSSNTIIDLGILPGGTNSYALGLNNSNQVVGASTISNGVLHGFLWDNGTLKDLNNLLSTNSGWELREATAINDQGQIAGWGTNQGSESAFLMTPSPLPSFSSLQLWFRADEGVIINGSGNVGQWLDQSGNGNHASQTVTVAEPVLATNAINGEPVVRFNGTSDYLSFPAVNTTNFTVFIVYRMTGHQAWSGPLENRAAGLYGFEVGSGSADTSVYEPELVESLGSQELADKTTGVGLSLPLGPVLQEWTSDERFFQDGLEQAVVNGATGWDVSGGRLGYAWSYMAGDIAEVLVYNTVLSDTDRQGVENYLNGKYAVLTPPPAPVISPAGGTYPGSVTVTLSTPTLGTQLYYTTDGSQPTTNSTLYAGAFNLSSNATVTAVSYLNGMGSTTTNADFVITAGGAPTTATGLAFWFRADEGVIINGSGNVGQWLDQSGNGNHASQTVTVAEPVLATNAINGEPVVRFNGTSDYLSFPAVNTTNFTVFIVYRMTGHQAWSGPLENRAAGLYGFEVGSGSADTSVYEPELVESLGSQELADKTTGVGLSLPLGPVLQEWTSDERFFQDGLEQAVVNGATGWDVSGGRLGYAWSYMAGDIAEVLVYNTVLSDTDRQGVENYLNGKYAVLTPPPAPVISPAGGTYPGSVTVTLSTPTLGTQLYYTTDGSQPTTNSTLYAGAFNLSSNATVTAVSYLNGMGSTTTNADFVITAGGAPTTATGLAFWFRADEGVIINGSGNVGQWLDQSGNGNHASQTVTVAEPVLATNAINGEPVVRFNGTSDYLSFPAVNTTNFTVFIVYRMTGHQAWSGPLENRAAGLYGFEVGSGSADTSVYEPELVESLGSQELADKTTGVGLSLPLGPVLQEWTSDERFFQDGLEQAVVNGATGWDVSGGRLGYAWSYMAGDIAEVLVYNTVLSDTDRQGVENYLNGKYFNPGNTNDYYNGNLPNITIIGGNNQSGLTNSWLPMPLTVQLTDTNALILTNAPVTFTLTQGSALIANSNNGTTTNVLQIVTDTNGQATVWLQLPSSTGTNIVTVSAQSGSNVVQVNFTEIAQATGGVPAMVAIGGERIMELNTNGNVLSWGGNEFGELGDYTYLDSTNIVVAVGLTNIVKIASSVNYSLAIDATGQLWTWGQLDQVDGTNLPVVISGMTNIIAIAAHDDQFFGGVSNKRLDPKTEYALSDPAAAVKSDGTVWMWGSSFCDDYGPTPVQIIGISNVIAVAMENCQVYAVTTNGDVWSWGNGNNTPAQMVGLSNIVSICGGDIHMLALDANGQLWAWGDNELGELGDGYAESSSSNPILVPGMTNVTEIAAGASDSLAQDASGRVWSWGGNHSNGYSEQTVGSPTQIMVISNAIAIAAGSDALAVITTDGTVWQWGSSDSDNSSWSWGSGVGAENPQLAPTYFDFYQGQLPTLTITNGNDQVISGNAESLNPLSFLVTDTNGLVLTNAPVSVEVVYGDIELRTNSGGANFKGLRLNSDNNGLVSLIAYADDAPVNLNCLIRVLAASKAQIREVDFTETLAPSPIIDITNPVNGVVILIGTNQPLTIGVDAEPADGASIQEVDYSFGTNSTADTSLGISTVTPYAFSWTNTLWWSNDFVGQYTISAVAVDNFGGRSDPSSINITVALDADGNGLPDYWEVEYFGTNGVDPNSSPDGNGQSILYDYQNGLSPTDYYNGVVPQLEIAGGNDQDGCANSFLPQPVAIKALKSVYPNFVQVLTNAPIVFTVTNGAALLAATTNDIPTNSLATRTDSNGVATVWVYFPPTTTTPPDSTILATAFSGSNSISTTINEFIPMGHWTFNDTNTWSGEGGQLPILTNNLIGIPDWSSNAVVIDNTNIALLAYNIMETNGVTNLTLNTGSIRFWFRPDWSSTNLGGNGPGAWGKLFEVGSYSPSLTSGWWSLYVDPSGTKISFATATNGFSTKNLTGNISWYSNEWYQIALTYSPTNSAVYVDGSILASGAGVSYWPNANELTNGFRIGSDENGTNQAAGTFDELETFNYTLSASNSYTHQTDLPDWWEVEYFNQTGLVPDSQPGNNGYNLLYSYSQGDDPNVITFSLYSSPYVNTNVTPLSIANLTGIPSSIAVMVEYNNNFAISITNLHLTSLDFSNAVWQPFDTNISASLAYGDGAYDIFVGMRGPAPNATVTWESIHVILGTVPPIIAVTNPVSSTASRPMIQLQGYANETLGSLTYDLSNAMEVLTNQSGFLTAQFYDTNVMGFTTNYFQCYDLMVTTNGPNVITLHATDLAGNTSSTNISVTVDYGVNTNPPSLQIFWPTNGTVVAGTSCNLSGSISDPTATVIATNIDISDDTNYTTDAFPAVVERSGLFFNNGLSLKDGTNVITLTATDVLGNITTSNIVVIADDTGLVINPIPHDELNQTNVTITGSVSDPTDQVTVNGVPATVNVDGTWEADEILVSDTGTASIGVQVSDAFGNPVASQNNSQDQPSTVAIQSVHGQSSSNYSSPLSGSYEPLSTDDFIFLVNSEDSLDWNYQSGGYDVGYDYYEIIYWFGSIGQNYSDYNNFVPPGNVFPGNFVGADLNDGGWQTSGGAQSELLGSQGGLTTTLATSGSTQTKIMIVPSGQGAVGGTTTYIVAAQVVDTDNNQQLPASAVQFKNQMPGSSTADVTNCDGSVWTEGLISGPAGANMEVTPIVAVNISYNNVRLVKTKQDWQTEVRDEIYADTGGAADMNTYNPANGFMANRKNLQAVYAFYQKLFTENGNLYWAGLGKLAGAPVYAGLSDAQNVTIALLGIGTEDLTAFQNQLITMNTNILQDLAWQSEAYHKGGIDALNGVYAVEPAALDLNTINAWREIHQGIQQNNASMVQAGNLQLAHREQLTVLQGNYDILNGMGGISTYMSILAQNPVPGASAFSAVVPSGNLCVFNDRWNWITNSAGGIWPSWMATPQTTQSTWVNIPLTTRAANYALLPIIQ